jgi:RNA polymerase sigma factor (sigma-70 family)
MPPLDRKTFAQLSDEELVHRLKEVGEPYAFAELIYRYEAKVLKKCQEYTRQPDDAEDLKQEIFIKLFLHVGTFKRESRFATWLYAVVHNTCIDYLRRHKKQLRQSLTQQVIESYRDMHTDTLEETETISIEQFEDLLQKLPPESQLVLLLKYKERQSIKDIQLALGLTESAVKMRLNRAREKINTLRMPPMA